MGLAGRERVLSQFAGEQYGRKLAEGIKGYTFDPRAPHELARLTHIIANGNDDLIRMGRASRARITAFSPEAFATNLLAAGEKAVAHARSRRRLP